MYVSVCALGLTQFSRLVDCLVDRLSVDQDFILSSSGKYVNNKNRHLSDLRLSEGTNPLRRPWGMAQSISLRHLSEGTNQLRRLQGGHTSITQEYIYR